MSVKSALQSVFHACGIEVRILRHSNSERQVLKDVLEATRIDTVLDVGANSGQFAGLAFDVGFGGVLVSFEAQESVHRDLVRRAARRGGSWIIAPRAAVGSGRGRIELNISQNSVSSSILPMRSVHLEAAPQSRYVGKETVDLARLDELATPLIPRARNIMIKVDTQGYERQVLEGATALLERTAAIQLELSLVPLYDGAPSFVELTGYVQQLGYELFSIVPGFRDRRSGRLLQMDGFFVRASAGR
jgi:FkbM family methyltransferase